MRYLADRTIPQCVVWGPMDAAQLSRRSGGTPTVPGDALAYGAGRLLCCTAFAMSCVGAEERRSTARDTEFDRTLRQMGFQPLALQGIRDRVIVLLPGRRSNPCRPAPTPLWCTGRSTLAGLGVLAHQSSAEHGCAATQTLLERVSH